ncbi:hypothetical protein GE061_007699 [Apolygus lucorum]|uniref:Uncharacterized protein n=1 Tax=Apolygus lucorum TaxID=248454 RepID=A0A8S9WQ67_APOLU|nr:hypothetical protein GE061_007699 [Apolygus lucorum]
MFEFLPQVKTFLCVLSLKAGTLVIGFVGLVTISLTLVLRIIYLLYLFNIKIIDLGMDEDTSEENKWIEVARTAFIIPTCVILLAATILLLIGTFKGEMNKLKLWIIVSLVIFVFDLVSALITTGAEFYKTDEPIPVRMFHFLKSLFFGIIYFLAEFYCIVVVNSFYQNEEE